MRALPYIPWSRGRDYDGLLDGEPWDPSQPKLNAAARDGLIHNLLSEEDLPSYHRVLAELFSLDGPWGTWVNRWTLEEDRHGTAIRDYLVVTRNADPVALRNDRARHKLFHRTVLQACMTMHPDRTLQAVSKVLRTFRPPGHGAPGFGRLVSSMARSGILSPETYHKDIASPFTRMLGAVDATGLGPVGRRAQEDVAAHLEEAAVRAGRYRALAELLDHLANT
ncbi:hypothetical protein DEJ49_34010 [Streptomyces venezuelae]|uniref:Acyl-ACP desaturase n=1 Tax=Streptomyces venezuelae TaxID=54571 RepID=A0A5P2CSS9_STRVZ|nr:acyl-ACP desaturase [Streptomyces venezuelae]QES45350.1 hypothetical protein DEJ49_34010 [Streptomyces venezuelae]